MRWIDMTGIGNWRCNTCGADFIFNEKEKYKYRYCPNCGFPVDAIAEAEPAVPLTPCYNCVNYHASIKDPDTFFHIHDYCSYWNKPIAEMDDTIVCGCSFGTPIK